MVARWVGVAAPGLAADLTGLDAGHPGIQGCRRPAVVQLQQGGSGLEGGQLSRLAVGVQGRTAELSGQLRRYQGQPSSIGALLVGRERFLGGITCRLLSRKSVGGEGGMLRVTGPLHSGLVCREPGLE